VTPPATPPQLSMPSRRVLVGACGMGNGHSARMQALVGSLQDRGHRVAIVTFGDGVTALEGAFAEPAPVLVPSHFPGAWVPMTPSGIDVPGSTANGRALGPVDDAWSFGLCERAVEALGGEPDVVLSDYEPASAQIAYMLGARLVTTEQQSKFLLHRTPDAGGYTRWHEAAKLRYFFPAADERIASSFFPVDEWERDERFSGRVIEPILRPVVLDLSPEVDETSVVVYLSPYGPMGQSPEQVLAALGAVPGVRFRVFTKNRVPATPGNVEVSPFDQVAFAKSLASCAAVLSTAGHQLLSECLYLGKPVLAIPFDVYEQQFNAMVLEHFGIGMRADEVSPAAVTELLARREELAAAGQELAARRFDGTSSRLVESLGL
jgi:uncharacterized protein (TIGR00661 family)